MSALEIELLGGVRVPRVTGGMGELAGRKEALLLAFLASPPGKRHRREFVQDLLWPGSEPAHAQGNLRSLLHQLKKKIPGLELQLRTDSRSIWLSPDHVQIDAIRFEALAREGTLAALLEACDLYSGDFLATATDTSLEYDEWLLPQRERLREIARSAYWALFSLRLWRGELPEARQCAERFLTIDPFCERMTAALIRLLIKQDEPVAAAAQYGRIRALLTHELQVRPGPEIEDLGRALGKTGGRSQSAPMTLIPFNAAWVLGRSDAISDGKPLIAVLPFRDYSDQPLTSLAAALTEDVISDLARFRRLSVLARHTSCSLLNHGDTEGRLRQLGARYSVEGNIRHNGNSLNVTVRLVDNLTMRHIWSERFQGGLDELPPFQDEAAKSIVAMIPVQVERAELERIHHREIRSLSAYELCLRGREYQRSTDHAALTLAQACFSRALEQDPESATAHSGLACCYVSTGSITPLDEERRRELAIEHAKQAIALDPLDAQGHWMLGNLLQMRRDFTGARFYLDRAVELSPGDVETLGYVGLEYAYAGEADRGIGLAERSIRLNPCYSPYSVEQMAKSCFIGQRYEDALFWLRQSPDRIRTNRGWLAAAAAYAGRMDEAAMHARLMRATLELHLGADELRAAGGPIGWLKLPARFQHAVDLDHYEHGLELAGLR